MLLKNKSCTLTHIYRALLHILLGLTEQDLNETKTQKAFRVLGIGNNKELLRVIKEKSALRLCSKASDPGLPYEKELFASNLYESVYSWKTGEAFTHDYSRKLPVVTVSGIT